MQKTWKVMAVCKEIMRNMKGMRKRIGHSMRYGRQMLNVDAEAASMFIAYNLK